MNKYGWICPLCNTVHAPFVVTCGCTQKTKANNRDRCIHNPVPKNEAPVDSITPKPRKDGA